MHVQDRHVLSYPVVAAFAKSHPRATLVLLDYHHDIASSRQGVTSVNWLGRLLQEGALSRVVWVSGRTLELPNRNARMKWLRRKLADVAPSDASRIMERVTLADWADLRRLKLAAPLAVTLDLDLLAHDPGNPPERFLDELSGWISDHRPALVTVALSAAYQRGPQPAWSWLSRFVHGFHDHGAEWYLEAGPDSVAAESREELGAWELWSGSPESFGRYGNGFWPGAGLWTQAPADVRDALLARHVRAVDASTQDVISGWQDPDRLALEKHFPEEALQALASAAAASLEASWTGNLLAEPPPGPGEEGLAVRLLSDGKDRGCLALYRGVTDPVYAARYCVQSAASDPRYLSVRPDERAHLEVEVSVFGPWHGMKDPLDFRPGLDSVLLEDAGRTTLLQASLAVQRAYDKEGFLRVLSRKAGLGDDGWRGPGLRWQRSSTIWYLRTLSSLEPVATASPRSN